MSTLPVCLFGIAVYAAGVDLTPHPKRLGALLARIAVISLLALSPEAAEADPPAVLDAIIAGKRLTIPLHDLIERVKLAPEQNFQVVEIGRDATSSHHVVAIRNREVPHRHDQHDLVVVILRGHGSLRLGDLERAVGVGSILSIPRATEHTFSNQSDEPAIAYAIYTPPFDGKDRVLTE